MQAASLKWKIGLEWQLIVLDFALLLFVAGIISTVNASVGGSSTFTLSLILAGAAIQAIRRISSKPITLSVLAVDLITLAFMAAVISNPRVWGMNMIALTLTAWVIVQALRYFGSKSTAPLSAVAQIAITTFSFFLMVSNPDYPAGYSIALVSLVIWVVAEAVWLMIERKFSAQ
jgi:hypothetical protein